MMSVLCCSIYTFVSFHMSISLIRVQSWSFSSGISRLTAADDSHLCEKIQWWYPAGKISPPLQGSFRCGQFTLLLCHHRCDMIILSLRREKKKKVSLSGQQGGIVSRATVVTVGLVQSKVVQSSALIVKADKQNHKSLTGVIIYVYNRL